MKNSKAFNEQLAKVRTIYLDNQHWFCLIDICIALKIVNVSKIKSNLKSEGIIIAPISGLLNRKEKANFIDKDNLYEIIFRSEQDLSERGMV